MEINQSLKRKQEETPANQTWFLFKIIENIVITINHVADNDIIIEEACKENFCQMDKMTTFKNLIVKRLLFGLRLSDVFRLWMDKIEFSLLIFFQNFTASCIKNNQNKISKNF